MRDVLQNGFAPNGRQDITEADYDPEPNGKPF